MGLVEIRGKVIVDKPLLSPVHGKPCAGYVWILGDGEKDDDWRWSWTRLLLPKGMRLGVCWALGWGWAW